MGVTYTPPDLSELKGEINRLLEMGGTNLTDAQRIGFLVNTGLTIAEAKAQTVNKLLVQDLNSSITDVGAKLTALDFTQHGQEFEVDTDGDGIMETVDLYDYKKEQALEGLKIVAEHRAKIGKNPLLNERFGKGLDMFMESSSAAIAYQDTMAGQRAGNIEELSELLTNYTDLVKSDPLLSHEGNFGQALTIVDKIKETKAYREKESGAKMLAKHTDPIDKALEGFKLLEKVHEADLDKTRAGVQIDIEDKYYPYLREAMERSGLEEGEAGWDYHDPYLKESRKIETTEAIGEISTEQYADALKWFDKWHDSKVTGEVADNIASLQSVQTAQATAYNDALDKLFKVDVATTGGVLDQLAKNPKTDTVQLKDGTTKQVPKDDITFGAISQIVFANTPQEKAEGTAILHENLYVEIPEEELYDPDTNPNGSPQGGWEYNTMRQHVELILNDETLIKKLADLSSDVSTEAEEMRDWRQIWGDRYSPDELSTAQSGVIKSIKFLNESLGRMEDKKNMDKIPITETPKSITPNVVSQYQRAVGTKLYNLMEQDKQWWTKMPQQELRGTMAGKQLAKFWSAYLTGDLASQFSHLGNLAAQFTDMSGAQYHYGDVMQMWDDDTDQVGAFYGILAAFMQLNTLYPVGAGTREFGGF